MKIDLLVIGSLPHKEKSQTFGGTTVLMQDFYDYLNDGNFDYKFIEANKFVFKGAFLLNFVYILFKCILFMPFSRRVMLNAASNGTFYLAPVLYVLARLFNMKFIFRKFAGSFDTLYKKQNALVRIVSDKTYLQSDIIFTETKHLVSFFNKFNANVQWFPNVRQKSVLNSNIERSFKKRFVFIGQVKETKGIHEIIESSNQIPDDYLIDIYGPIMDDKITEDYFQQCKANYKGPLIPTKVLSILNDYDVLLLPTYHPGEGYPGIIIEAYSLGIPVITTKWKSIPEIVVNGKTGFLTEPKSSALLTDSILGFNSSNYQSLSEGSKLKFSEFDREVVNERVLDQILKL